MVRDTERHIYTKRGGIRREREREMGEKRTWGGNRLYRFVAHAHGTAMQHFLAEPHGWNVK
jgi:hypothetical protein